MRLPDDARILLNSIIKSRGGHGLPDNKVFRCMSASSTRTLLLKLHRNFMRRSHQHYQSIAFKLSRKISKLRYGILVMYQTQGQNPWTVKLIIQSRTPMHRREMRKKGFASGSYACVRRAKYFSFSLKEYIDFLQVGNIRDYACVSNSVVKTTSTKHGIIDNWARAECAQAHKETCMIKALDQEVYMAQVNHARGFFKFSLLLKFLGPIDLEGLIGILKQNIGKQIGVNNYLDINMFLFGMAIEAYGQLKKLGLQSFDIKPANMVVSKRLEIFMVDMNSVAAYNDALNFVRLPDCATTPIYAPPEHWAGYLGHFSQSSGHCHNLLTNNERHGGSLRKNRIEFCNNIVDSTCPTRQSILVTSARHDLWSLAISFLRTAYAPIYDLIIESMIQSVSQSSDYEWRFMDVLKTMRECPPVLKPLHECALDPASFPSCYHFLLLLNVMLEPRWERRITWEKLILLQRVLAEILRSSPELNTVVTATTAPSAAAACAVVDAAPSAAAAACAVVDVAPSATAAASCPLTRNDKPSLTTIMRICAELIRNSCFLDTQNNTSSAGAGHSSSPHVSDLSLLRSQIPEYLCLKEVCDACASEQAQPTTKNAVAEPSPLPTALPFIVDTGGNLHEISTCAAVAAAEGPSHTLLPSPPAQKSTCQPSGSLKRAVQKRGACASEQAQPTTQNAVAEPSPLPTAPSALVDTGGNLHERSTCEAVAAAEGSSHTLLPPPPTQKSTCQSFGSLEIEVQEREERNGDFSCNIM